MPQLIQNASQAPVEVPPTYRGVPCQPYQGPRTYGWRQPYHPYQRAPVAARGRGCGR